MPEVPTRTTPLTLDLPTDVVERLGALAERTGGTVEDLVRDAIADRLSYLEWKIAAIQEAIEEVDEGGPTYSNEEVMAWIESWGKPDELPPQDDGPMVAPCSCGLAPHSGIHRARQPNESGRRGAPPARGGTRAGAVPPAWSAR